MARSHEGGVRCPLCGYEESKVIDTHGTRKPSTHHVATKRRRECLKCGRRFNTLELEEQVVHDWYDVIIMVAFKDNIHAETETGTD